jgi:Mce-associated membrane protein
VEDQRPPAGDLTTDEISGDESGDDTSVETDAAQTEAGQSEPEASEAESTIDSPDEGETDAGTAKDDEATVDQTADEADGGLRQRRPVGRRLAIAAAAAAALFVGSAAFAGATAHQYVTDRATVVTKLRIASTAANAITTLWTYTPDNMDKLADRAAQYLSGDFEAQYRKYIDAIVAPNKQAQITNTTQVTGAAVESLDGPDATALVYTNTTSTSPATKDVPSLKYLSYRLVMKRDHARWLVTKMTTITSLDLTPQF